MRTNARRTAQLGDVVAAAFDEAARYSADPQEVLRLATQALVHLLRRSTVPNDGPVHRIDRPASPAGLRYAGHALA